jgi:hypothetical protein
MDTTTVQSTRQTSSKQLSSKKSVKKAKEPAPASSDELREKAAAAAAGSAAIDSSSNTGSTPPSGTAATAEPALPVNPPAPEVASPVEEKASERTQTKQGSSIGTWVLGAIALAGLAGIVLLISRRSREETVSIYGRSITGSHPIVHPRHS